MSAWKVGDLAVDRRAREHGPGVVTAVTDHGRRLDVWWRSSGAHNGSVTDSPCANFEPPAATALHRWYGNDHRWTREELGRMAAAVAAPDVDAALDVWFNCGTCDWRDHGEHFPAQYRGGMAAAREAAGHAE